MYLISACLIGVNCRYDGKSVPNEELKQLFQKGKAIAICPEVLGGLKTPRECCEIVQDSNGAKYVISESNKDFTSEYALGAKKALEICKAVGIKTAILKSKSPSCGYGKIYDGSFSKKMIEGNGLTADLLEKNQIKILNEMNWT